MSDSRALGFFDSGLGGLTVLRAVHAKFPEENLVYLGDTARLPYGTKSPETIRRYADQCVENLISRNVKAVVVACNSASTVLLGDASKKYPVPVYNVIEPGAEAALASSTSKRIGVLGTRATVNSNAYPNAIQALDPKAIVYQNAAPLLVPLVEEGWELDPLTNLIIYRYVAPLMSQSIDTLILGCTHYPVLRAGIERVTGSGISLVDSAELIVRNLERDFASGKLSKRVSPKNEPENGKIELFATDASHAMDVTARRLLQQPSAGPFMACDL